MEKVIFQDLGLIEYKEAWDYQQRLHEKLKSSKLQNRKLLEAVEKSLPQIHYLIFCEHPPVYTLGKTGSEKNLLRTTDELHEEGFEFYKINRGGDITYHGPGQIVGYPIFDLDCFFTDVHKYVRYLEEIVMRTLLEYGISSKRVKGFTGVWLEKTQLLPERKICAIGVHLSRWVTLHGFAFNVNSNLSHFSNIIPCGIQQEGKDVTSLQRELGSEVPLEEVKEKLKNHFLELFEFEFDEG
ncbi:MAG: lipoyl(octanoyl) transferase LipB [Bacteroidetes bacterium]|nr:lipoyl(octanoyl) transferase LipB [Bacteroidota bacterium]